jgi:hypothetical protein
MENDQLVADFMAEDERSVKNQRVGRNKSNSFASETKGNVYSNIESKSVDTQSQVSTSKKRYQSAAGKSLVFEKLNAGGTKATNSIMIRFSNSKFVKQIQQAHKREYDRRHLIIFGNQDME